MMVMYESGFLRANALIGFESGPKETGQPVSVRSSGGGQRSPIRVFFHHRRKYFLLPVSFGE